MNLKREFLFCWVETDQEIEKERGWVWGEGEKPRSGTEGKAEGAERIGGGAVGGNEGLER